MPMKNRNVSPATAALISALLFVMALGNTWSQPAEHSISPANVKSVSPTWAFATGGDVPIWNTGDEALARAALAPNFIDKTLPPGRPQGFIGPLAASKVMRAAIPDMGCEIEQMIVAGDRVVAHLRFHGHFTGRFKQMQGQGQTINFIATDIYRIADGRIAENWHIEDNLTLQQQLGLIVE
jgi:predicted ester cyclase